MFEALNILIVFLLVLANGFFVASEFALVGVRRSRIAALAEAGDRRAQRLLGLVDNLNAYISATQLGITLASLALGWIGEPAVAHLLEIPLVIFFRMRRYTQLRLRSLSASSPFFILSLANLPPRR